VPSLASAAISELIESVQRAPQLSLIEIRAGFEAEVVKTMENM
jgi:hypothetical protein